MRFYLLSDNTDTAIGFRLAGVEGSVVHEKEEVITALGALQKDPDIGIVLITEKLASLCRAELTEIKLLGATPLIAEIPDRHGGADVIGEISRYVKESTGIEI